MASLLSYHFEEDDPFETSGDATALTGASSAITLKELMDQAARAVRQTFPHDVWVIAEVSSISPPKTGNVFLTLVEKAENGNVIAKVSGNIWQRSARQVLGGFRAETGSDLAPGMKVLLSVEPGLHPAYGFSVNIKSIDSSYTLGELERQRRETLERLTRDNLIGKNKLLTMPLVPQRVALISSQGAAGYEDFVHQIARNPQGYYFNCVLFHALVQGDAAPQSIIAALKNVVRRKDEFDVVVILRGGGSKIDMLCFDDYEVARAIAWTPLPVITGIGHERDESIADIVAHTRCKTPTAVAEFLITLAADFEDDILDLRQRVVQSSVSRLQIALSTVDRIGARLREMVGRAVHDRTMTLSRQVEQLRTLTLLRIERENGILNGAIEKLALLDPINVLKRGYSLVYAGSSGKLIRNAADIAVGESIRVQVAEATIDATVTEIAQTTVNEKISEAEFDGASN